jgi:dTMP kinase
MLVAVGEEVHVTAEPSNGPIGAPARELTESVTGYALACLYAADRYYHVRTEIEPALHVGSMVISDRYIPSGLVTQRFDGVDLSFLWQLNSKVARPGLTIILEADAEVIAERLHDRGAHNRFQHTPGSSLAENRFYQQATDHLIEAGFDVLRVDCNARAPEQVAAHIRDRLLPYFALSEG